MKSKILATFGSVLVLSAVWAHVRITHDELYRFSDDERDFAEHALQSVTTSRGVSATYASRSSDTMYAGTTTAHLTYSETMRENETNTVTIEYAVTTTIAVGSDTRSLKLESLAESASATLSSSALTVAPQTTIRKEAGTTLPTRFLWTVTPKKNGEHYLIVDLSDILDTRHLGIELPEPARGFEEVTVNGEHADWSTARIQTLPIVVYTHLGISEATFDLIKLALGIFGTALTVGSSIATWIRSRRRSSTCP